MEGVKVDCKLNMSQLRLTATNKDQMLSWVVQTCVQPVNHVE